MRLVAEPDVGIWSPQYRRFTVGIYVTILLAAFEGLAVTTVAPVIAADLHALGRYTWILTAAMMPQIVGSVVFAWFVDRRGIARPFLIGVTLFGAGLLMAALAQNMLFMILARAVQGLGMGAVVNAVYASINLVLPDRLRPRAFALVAGAYVLPALVGPPLTGVLTDQFSWRAVFLAVLPLLLAMPFLVLPIVSRLPSPETAAAPGFSNIGYAVLLAVGVVVTSTGFAQGRTVVGAAMVLGGLAVTFTTARRVLPDGVFRARPVRSAALAARGLVTAGFLGGEAVVAYSLTVQHGRPVTMVGVAIGCAALSWALAAWLQSRWDTDDDGAGRGRRLCAGTVCLLVGEAVILSVPWVTGGSTAFLVAAIGHAVAGFGIGLAESTSGAMAMGATPEGESGVTASGIQLADLVTPTLGLALTGFLLATLDGSRTRLGISAAVLGQIVLVLLAVLSAWRVRHVGAAHLDTPA